MSRGLFIGLLMTVIVIQAGALSWLGYQHYFSIDSAWNRYRAGERLLREVEVSGAHEQIRRGVQMMDGAHRQLLAAGEIVPLFVPYGSRLEKIIEENRIPNLLSGTQGTGGQRAVSKKGQALQVDVRAFRYLQKFYPKELSEQ